MWKNIKLLKPFQTIKSLVKDSVKSTVENQKRKRSQKSNNHKTKNKKKRKLNSKRDKTKARVRVKVKKVKEKRRKERSNHPPSSRPSITSLKTKLLSSKLMEKFLLWDMMCLKES